MSDGEPYRVGPLTPLPLWEALLILAVYALALWPLALAAWLGGHVGPAWRRWVVEIDYGGPR